MTELEHQARYWIEGWNSHRALAVLNRRNSEDLNHIVAFMAVTLSTAYRQLRTEMEDPNNHEVSWHYPKLTLSYELPFEMNTGGLLPISTQEEIWSCEMVAVLDLLAGQLILEWNEESQDFKPRYFGLNLDSTSTTTNWPTFSSSHHSIQGLASNGDAIEIALAFKFSPRFVIPKEKRTFGEINVELTYSTLNDDLHPHHWSRSEASAFWDCLFAILGEVGLRARGREFSREMTRAINGRPANRRSGIRRFVAKFVSLKGVDLYDTLSPPTLSETTLSDLEPFRRSTGPLLDILDHQGQLHPLAIQQIVATIHFPGHDPSECGFRSACFARLEVQNAYDAIAHAMAEGSEADFPWPDFLFGLGAQGLISPSTFRHLASPPHDFDTMWAERTKIGFLAGKLLLQILACSIHHPEHASVRKAVFLYSAELKANHKPKGERFNDNRSKIISDWSQMRSVAHLWGAMVLLDEPDGRRFFSNAAEFTARLLATSEALRMHGEARFAQGRTDKRAPILDPASTWRPPSSLDLPIVKLEPSPLPKAALEILKSYRAER